MGSLNTQVFARRKFEPNTFIGGIAKLGGTGVNAPINSRTLLADKLQIAGHRISAFKIIGDNVQCRIKGIYNINSNTFGKEVSANANKNIINYYDNDNLVRIIGENAFRNTTLADSKFDGATTVNPFAFTGCLQTEFNMPSVTSSSAGWRNHSALRKLTLNGLVTQQSSTFMNCNNPLLEVSMISLVNGGQLLFSQLNSLFNDLSGFPNLKTLGGLCFHNCTGFTTINLNLTSISGGQAFYGVYNCENYYLNSLASISGDTPWRIGNQACKVIEIKKCKTLIGVTRLVHNEGVLVPHNSDFTVRINQAIETSTAIVNLQINFPHTVVEVFDDAETYLYTL